MKRIVLVLIGLLTLNLFVAGGIAYQEYARPVLALSRHGDEYQELMFRCDFAMQQHFLAKQQVVYEPTESNVLNLEAAELALLDCHEYDKLRKTLLGEGATENDLSILGLQAIESKSEDIRQIIEIHEIRY